jgi:UDP-N-acetylmuramoyl-L-alanyl-D-glutamate--2,6-diaminopimelate ligase
MIMEAKSLRRLKDIFPETSLPDSVVVTGLKLDSRLVEPGDLFVAIPGMESDGRNFIPDAINNGAVAVLYEANDESPLVQYSPGQKHAPQLEGVEVPNESVPGLAKLIGSIASRYYSDPSEQMKVIAVTGTNGKTSCCHFLAGALNSLGVRCGVMGTLGYGVGGKIRSFGMTTPSAVDTQKYLAEMLADGARVVVLEASSHGLDQGRLNGTRIASGIFTNITRDHLDYHKSEEGYRRSKKRLFEFPGIETAVLNHDDQFGQEMIAELKERMKVISYSTVNSVAGVYSSNVSQNEEGVSATINSPWGVGLLTTRLYGVFNLSNLLAVFCVLCAEGYPIDLVIERLGQIENVKGRMDRIESGSGVHIVVDYAHTPDALDKVLRTLRSHCGGALWCLFGCGGDRDRGKRPQMGQIAVQLSDHVVITDDNPRHEDSQTIVRDILAGIEDRAQVQVEPDRGKAIRLAIGLAQPDDIVLIAGKGHEDYQEIGGKRYHFSDYEEVRHAVS